MKHPGIDRRALPCIVPATTKAPVKEIIPTLNEEQSYGVIIAACVIFLAAVYLLFCRRNNASTTIDPNKQKEAEQYDMWAEADAAAPIVLNSRQKRMLEQKKEQQLIESSDSLFEEST